MVQKIVLVDEGAEVVELFSVVADLISQNLNGRYGTLPEIVRVGSFLWVSKDKRVVFPDPDGPIMANNYPGLQ